MALITLLQEQTTDLHLFTIPKKDAAGEPVGNKVTVQFRLNQTYGTSQPDPAAYHKARLSCKFDDSTYGKGSNPGVGAAAISYSFDPIKEDLISLTLELQPKAKVCETYCLIVYDDPKTAPNTERDYAETLVRITVHKELLRFWIGHTRITLLNSDVSNPDHKKIDAATLRVYAECSNDTYPNSLANLTGNSYLTYLSDSPELHTATEQSGIPQNGHLWTVQPASTDVAAPCLVTNIGVKVGVALPTGAQKIPVYALLGARASQPLLRRFHTGKVSDHTRKHKILVLTDGFKNKDEVDVWLAYIQNQLFTTEYHTPFRELAEDIDLWTADLLSYDNAPGITLESPLSAEGYPIPCYPLEVYQGRPVDSESGSASIIELLRAVGLPAIDGPRTLEDATKYWANNPRYVALTGSKKKVGESLFNAWLMQMPATFVYAKDTVFGTVKGTVGPQLQQTSPTDSLARGDWATTGTAPNMPHHEDSREAYYPGQDRLASILATFKTQNTKRDPDIAGDLWAYNSPDKKAAGLVCLLIKDMTAGGSSFSFRQQNSDRSIYYTSFFSTGVETQYQYIKDATKLVTNFDFTHDAKGKVINELSPPPPFVTQVGMAVLVHEVGHLLGLGDEYGNYYGKSHGNVLHTKNSDAVDAVDRFINIVSINELAKIDSSIEFTGQLSLGGNYNAPLPEAGRLSKPEKLRWNWDRTLYAGTIVGAPTVVDAASFKVRLELGDGQTWAVGQDAKAILRSRELTAGPIDQASLMEYKIKDVNVVAATTPPPPAVPTEGYCELVLEGTPPAAIGIGDVGYIPPTYADHAKMQLVAGEVAGYLRTKSFKVTKDLSADQLNHASYKPQKAEKALAKAMRAEWTRVNKEAEAAQKPKPISTLRNATGPNLRNIIAVYEGGGEYDALVYRSNGFSKMRLAYNLTVQTGSREMVVSSIPQGSTEIVSIEPFNYVSRYFLINKINPTRLAELDHAYYSQAT